MSSSSRITVVKPSAAVPLAQRTRVWMPSTTASTRKSPPRAVMICMGAQE